MLHERWERLAQLFADALAQPEAERLDWLARACGGDVDMLREIQGLLHAEAATGVLDILPLDTSAVKSVAIEPSLPDGARIGAWRIERLVGRGGMGEVYCATRAEAGFTQRGALKLLRFEAIGELARFHAERQILARLNHPGIARLLDGGVALDGRPYTVMEFVDGVSLTAYCIAHYATIDDRLDLFLQICDAVAYAHRNLVIHRDLKPANTLVDADGKTKLLDFGIAKLIDASASPDTADRNFTAAPFTPDYAAPEQLTGEPVTTATDVYALGVLLFELLTGQRPSSTSNLPSAKAFALRRNREALAPSRVARENSGAPLPPAALTGDLDAIVARCLRREPAHRYDTVSSLKLDIQRHRRREPVFAREGARLYVIGRLLRRYRGLALATTALVVALTAGLAGTLWQAHRAETQSRTAIAVQTFVTDLFRANSSNQKNPIKARATQAHELLDLGAKKINAEMNDAPAAKLNVVNLLADLYDELALRKEEIDLRRQGVELARGLYGSESPELVNSLTALIGAMHGTDAAPEREPLLREALAILDTRGDRDSEVRGRLMQKFAELYENSDPTKGLDYAQQSVRALAMHPPTSDLAEAWYLQGLMQTNMRQFDVAETSLNRAAEISITVQGPANPKLIVIYYQLADTQKLLKNFTAAERSARQAFQIALATNGEEHIDAVRTRMMLGTVLIESGRRQEGLDLLTRAKRDVLKIAGPDDPFHTPDVLEQNGVWESEIGDVGAGLADLQDTLRIRRNLEGDSLHVAGLLRQIALDQIDLGRNEDAHQTIDAATAIYEAKGRVHGTTGYNVVTTMWLRFALAEGRINDARRFLAELIPSDDPKSAATLQISERLIEAEIALETTNRKADVDAPIAVARDGIERVNPTDNKKLYLSSADQIDGESHLRRHEAIVALPLLQRSLKTREEFLLAPNPRLIEAQTQAAICYLELARLAEAHELAAAATANSAKYLQLGERYAIPLRNLQDGLKAVDNRAVHLGNAKLKK